MAGVLREALNVSQHLTWLCSPPPPSGYITYHHTTSMSCVCEQLQSHTPGKAALPGRFSWCSTQWQRRRVRHLLSCWCKYNCDVMTKNLWSSHFYFVVFDPFRVQRSEIDTFNCLISSILTCCLVQFHLFLLALVYVSLGASSSDWRSVSRLAQNGAPSALHENMTDKQKGDYLLCLLSLQCLMPGNQYPSGMCWDNTAHEEIIPENLEWESEK